MRDMVTVKAAREVFKCEVCGNVVEIKQAGGGERGSCDQPMVGQK